MSTYILGCCNEQCKSHTKAGCRKNMIFIDDTGKCGSYEDKKIKKVYVKN